MDREAVPLAYPWASATPCRFTVVHRVSKSLHKNNSFNYNKVMIKKPFPTQRPGGKVPRLTPPTAPDWYKRFRQLAAIAGKQFKVKP